MTSSAEEKSEPPDIVVEEEPKCLDDLLTLGKYSFLILFACELIILPQTGNLMFMVFGGATPRVLGCGNKTLSPAEACLLYDNRTCENPILEYEFYSTNVEFKLLCSDGSLVKDSTSYQMFGYMLGTLIFGQISDVYGRKWPMFICVFLTGLLGVASSFSTSLMMFTVIRVALSFFNTGHIVIVVVYMCETFPKNHRMWMNFIVSWSPNIILITIIAYYSVDWRTYAVAVNSFAFLACAILFFSTESSYWLLRQGRIKDAEHVIKKITRWNGKQVDEALLVEVLAMEQKKFESTGNNTRYYFHHLFFSWRLVSYTVTMIFSYLAVGIINYGIMFNLEQLAGSMYFNLLTIGILRFILNILSAFSDFNFAWLGRRVAHFTFAGYTMFAVVLILILNFFGLWKEWSNYTRYLVISASSMASQIYITNQVSCSEIYPTPVRNIAYAMTQLSGSMGSIFAPQLFTLGKYSEALPFLVMLGLQALESSLFFALIPESKGKPLADIMPGVSERICMCGKRDVVDVPLQSHSEEIDRTKSR